MWIMWITWCISLLFPQKRKNENVDNFVRTDVLKRISNGENREKLCILSKECPVREKEVENHIKIIHFFNGNWQKIDQFQDRRVFQDHDKKDFDVIWTLLAIKFAQLNFVHELSQATTLTHIINKQALTPVSCFSYKARGNLQAFFVFRQHDVVAVCSKGGKDAANKGKQATKFGSDYQSAMGTAIRKH